MLGFLLYSLERSKPFVALAGALAATLSARSAIAGCGDGACGRVDWTEVTESKQGTPVAAKLHGAFSWEASPDGWVTHPIGGTMNGYVWLTCVPPNDSGPVEATCTNALATEMAKAGTTTPFTWGGVSYYDTTTMKVTVPVELRSESESGSATYLVAFPLGASPINQSVCPTAFAFGKDAGPPDAGATADSGAAGGSPSTDAAVSGTGSTHGSTSGGGPTGRGGTTGDAATGAGGASSTTGGRSSSGGRAVATATGGDGPSPETGGALSDGAPAADAGGGCRVSMQAAPSSSRSTAVVAGLALGLAALRRARTGRPRPF